MSSITVHYTIEEWEGNHSINCWINFSVLRDTIGVDNLLKWICEFVAFNEGWFSDIVSLVFLKVSSWELGKCFFDGVFFIIWNPKISNISRLSLSHVIKCMIKCLFLSYKPLVNFKRADFLILIRLIITVVNLVDLV